MSEAIDDQIERFAPGFRKRIVKKVVTTAKEFGSPQSNVSGGVINGGIYDHSGTRCTWPLGCGPTDYPDRPPICALPSRLPAQECTGCRDTWPHGAHF